MIVPAESLPAMELPKVIQKITYAAPNLLLYMLGEGVVAAKVRILGSQHSAIRHTWMMTAAAFCFRKCFLSRAPLYHRTTAVDARRSRRRRLKCSAALRYLRITAEFIINGCEHRGWVVE